MGRIKRKTPIKIPLGLCVKCNDGKMKPCIGKRDKALCATIHYKQEHQRSAKGKEDDKIYLALQKIFLAANNKCAIKLPGCTHTATEVHHKRGRGKYYLDTNTFLPGCHHCHRIITDGSALAYEHGVSEKRLEVYEADPKTEKEV